MSSTHCKHGAISAAICAWCRHDEDRKVIEQLPLIIDLKARLQAAEARMHALETRLAELIKSAEHKTKFKVGDRVKRSSKEATMPAAVYVVDRVMDESVWVKGPIIEPPSPGATAGPLPSSLFVLASPSSPML
jgi:hypothetical protein